jgi:hypothetical protein
VEGGNAALWKPERAICDWLEYFSAGLLRLYTLA